jgi:hypothetical protein
MKKGIVGAVIVFVIVVGAVVYSSSKSSKNDADMMKKEQADITTMTVAELMEREKMEKEAMEKKIAEEGVMTKKDDGVMMKKEEGTTMSIKGSYGDYDASKLSNAEKGDVVLFFHAPWCPSCATSNKNFLASPTPDRLTLLKVDFDSSTALRQKYDVTYQHTFVQVDKNGNLIKKWSGTFTYEDLVSQLK